MPFLFNFHHLLVISVSYSLLLGIPCTSLNLQDKVHESLTLHKLALHISLISQGHGEHIYSGSFYSRLDTYLILSILSDPSAFFFNDHLELTPYADSSSTSDSFENDCFCNTHTLSFNYGIIDEVAFTTAIASQVCVHDLAVTVHVHQSVLSFPNLDSASGSMRLSFSSSVSHDL